LHFLRQQGGVSWFIIQQDATQKEINIPEFHNYNTLQNNEMTWLPNVETNPTEGFTDFARTDAVYSTDGFAAKYSS